MCLYNCFVVFVVSRAVWLCCFLRVVCPCRVSVPLFRCVVRVEFRTCCRTACCVAVCVVFRSCVHVFGFSAPPCGVICCFCCSVFRVWCDTCWGARVSEIMV